MSRKTAEQTDKQAGTRNAQEPRGAQPMRSVTLRDAYEALDQALDMLARCGDKDNTPGGIRSLGEVQRAYTLAVLACCNGHRTRAAARLRIGRATLYRRLDKYQDDGDEIGAIGGPVAGSTVAKPTVRPTAAAVAGCGATAAEARQDAQWESEYLLEEADKFLAASGDMPCNAGRYRAVSYLQRAAAFLVQGALTVFTGQCPGTYRLEALLGESPIVTEKLGPPVPPDVPDGWRLSHMLADSLYRVDDSWCQVSTEDLKRLREHVKRFRDRVVEVCREHLKTNATQSEPGVSEMSD